jgi:ATP-dependent DNA helicase RecG
VIGLKNSKKLLVDIPNKVRDTLEIMVDVNLLQKDDKEYLEIVVQPSSYPVNYKGEYHYRSGSTKQILIGSILTDFLLLRTRTEWESVPVDFVSYEDLDKESFDIFRREAIRSGRMAKEALAIDNKELLRKLNLLVDNKLKRAAVLLFHRDPERWITGSHIKVGKFGIGSDLQYQDEVMGSLMLQTDRVIDLIYLKYLKASITYDKDVRIETYPFPRDAIREAIFNAIIHKHYASGNTIQVRIEDEAMYISNNTAFLTTWTEEKLMKQHQSIPYNPDIAKTFFRAGYVEAWGRGIQKICEACQHSGNPNPEYIIYPQSMMVKFTALETSLSKVNGALNGALDGTLESKIMNLLKINSTMTQKELSEILKISTRTLQRIIHTLVVSGSIERIGGKRFGYWKVHKK